MVNLDLGDDQQSLASPSTSTLPNQRNRRLPVHRCRFPDWTPSAISALTITPTSFGTALLGFGGASRERGVVGVGRANGDVELMLWGGHQGWVSWRVSLVFFLRKSSSPGTCWEDGYRGRKLELTCPAFTRTQTLPSSFPLPNTRNSKKPTSLLSHLLFTHQTTLSPADLELYDGDLPGAEQEVRRLEREGVRLFGVGGVGSELVEWEWGGPGSSKEVGRIKVRFSRFFG
jgi:U3 small nucleolar RNA-associated protein 4